MEIGVARRDTRELGGGKSAAPAVSYREHSDVRIQAPTENGNPWQVDYLHATPEQIDALDEFLLILMHNLV
jgi:hypothetical protein